MTFVQGRWQTSSTLQIGRNANSCHHLLTLEGHAPHYYWAEQKRQPVPWSPPIGQRGDLIATRDDGNPNCPPGLLWHLCLQEVVFLIVRRAEPDSLTFYQHCRSPWQTGLDEQRALTFTSEGTVPAEVSGLSTPVSRGGSLAPCSVLPYIRELDIVLPLMLAEGSNFLRGFCLSRLGFFPNLQRVKAVFHWGLFFLGLVHMSRKLWAPDLRSEACIVGNDSYYKVTKDLTKLC